MNRVALLKLAAVKEKRAGIIQGTTKFKDYARMLGMALLGGGAVAGAGSLMSGGAEKVRRMGKGRAFQSMLAQDSELKRMHKQNPAKVQDHFNTLFRFNPEMAKDPLVASSFVKGTAQHDFLAHKTVQDLIKTRKDLLDTGKVSLFSLPT